MTSRDPELLARSLLADQPRRWAHVRGVARCAAELQMEPVVVTAAWLHDIGYSPEVKDTGMHAIDGAAYLLERCWSDEVVSLVAHHTGAWSEAASRGLSQRLDALPRPHEDNLDALTLCDLLVGPDGRRTSPSLRVDEILRRYAPSHPVNEAVMRSRSELMARASRGWSRLSADVRAATPLKGVL